MFKKPLMNALLLPSCIMFHVKAGITYNPSSQASPTQTRTHTHVYMDLRCQDVYLCYDSLLGLRLGQPTIIFAAWYSQQF